MHFGVIFACSRFDTQFSPLPTVTPPAHLPLPVQHFSLGRATCLTTLQTEATCTCTRFSFFFFFSIFFPFLSLSFSRSVSPSHSAAAAFGSWFLVAPIAQKPRARLMNFTTSRCESSGQLRLAYMFYLCVCVYSPYSSPPPFFHGALPRDFNNSRSNSGRAPKQRDKRRSDMQAALLCEAVAAAAAIPFATYPLPCTTPYPGLSSSVLAPPLGRHQATCDLCKMRS